MAKTALTEFIGKALSEDNAGTEITGASAAARGTAATGRPNTFQNDGRKRLRVTNSNAAAAATTAYVTVRSKVKSDQGFYNHVVIEAAKNKTFVAGPFPRSRFGAEVELYYTSDAPDRNIEGDGTNGFKATGTLADLGTELTSAEAAELTVEVLG